MVFVTVGTEKFQFDRLVKEIDTLAANKKINDKVFIQLGSCAYEPKHCEWKRFLPFDEMQRMIADADLVISHAASTLFVCCQYGKKPILVPRRKRFKELIDDHQMLFAEKMKEIGYDRIVLDVGKLMDSIETCLVKGIDTSVTWVKPVELVDYLTNLVASWEK